MNLPSPFLSEPRKNVLVSFLVPGTVLGGQHNAQLVCVSCVFVKYGLYSPPPLSFIINLFLLLRFLSSFYLNDILYLHVFPIWCSLERCACNCIILV